MTATPAARCSRSRRRRNQTWWRAYRRTLFCVVCGDDRPAVLDLHHRRRDTKRADVSRMVHKGYSLAAIKAEAAKCSALCASCHRLYESSYDRTDDRS